jgi:aminopeptidase YwaD
MTAVSNAILEQAMIGELWNSPDLWDNLAYLCDACSSRFAGTEDERRAGDYMMERFRAYGLQNVHAEAFEMRGWERGPASLTVLDGSRAIAMRACIALPGTFGCDIEAEIVDAGQGSPADFERLGNTAAGKIVLTSSDGPGRGDKYLSAIAAGAVAFIFANAHPGLLAPTGSIAEELPGVGLSYEDAAEIRRMLKKNAVRARLTVSATVLNVTARNIVGEIPGSDPQQGWILACGHYDGHDVSQGAQDNAAGSAILVEAARLLAPLREHLKMGIRFVLFSGEELGLYGSYAYAPAHAAEHDQIRLVFNADVLALAMPLVLQTQASPALAAYLRTLALDELDCVVNDGPRSFIMNSDHFPFSLAGIQAVWALTSSAPSGAYIHTAADTLDKVEPRLLRQTAAALTRVLWRMTSDPAGIPQGRKTPDELQKDLAAAGFETALRAAGHWPF